MPGKGLENLKRDNQTLAVMGNIASAVILCSGKPIYAVVKVQNPQIEESDNENLIK